MSEGDCAAKNGGSRNRVKEKKKSGKYTEINDLI